jgi:hypothetical protein
MPAGVTVHVTLVFPDPVTPGVKVCDWLAPRLTLDGPSETATGVRFTEALADFVVSAALVAVMVTVCAERIVAGAV